MAKRSSLFGQAKAEVAMAPDLPGPPISEETQTEGGRKYPVAKTREGKRVAVVYLEKEALKQLQRVAIDEESTMQAMLTEAVNLFFEKRGLSRIA